MDPFDTRSVAQEWHRANDLFQTAFESLDPQALRRALDAGAQVDWLVPVRAPGVLAIERAALIETLYRSEPQSVDFLRALLDAGASLTDLEIGAHALHHCCDDRVCDPLEKARLLLSRGADPGFKDRHGRQAAHIACWRDQRQELCAPLLRLLAEAGADLAALDASGHSPFDTAIEHGNLPAVQALWEMSLPFNGSLWESHSGRGNKSARHWPAAKALLASLEERKELSIVSPPIADSIRRARGPL